MFKSRVFFGDNCSSSANILDVTIDDRFHVVGAIYCLVLSVDNEELYFASKNEIENYCNINHIDIVNKEKYEIEGLNEEPTLYWGDEYIKANCEFWYEYDESNDEF